MLPTKQRAQIIETMSNTEFDVVVIGGGITGAGIALDAASRGLKTALVEKLDFASGTSSRSTKLIHGGLRYLKQLEISLVREYGRERAVMHRLAPHLVRSEKMLLPLIQGGTYSKFATSVGLMVYDVLAGVEKADQRMMLSKQQTLNLEPLLPEDKVEGGGIYSEYRTDDARLTIEVIKTASKYGACCVNYVEVQDFIYQNNKIAGVKCHNRHENHFFEIKAKYVVNAAGAWVDSLRAKNNSMNGKRLQHSKGVHIVVKKEKLPIQQAIYFDVPDGRMIFAIPRGNTTYIGTTDTPYNGSLEKVKVMREDVDYLVNSVNSAFPSVQLKVEDVISSWAGVRPLIYEEGKATTDISRKDEIFESESGLITIAGGKLTGFRKMAERVVDLVAKKFLKDFGSKVRKCRTDHLPLCGGNFESQEQVDEFITKLAERIIPWGLTMQNAEYLVENYGKQTKKIIKKMLDLMENNPRVGLIRAELWFTLENEMVLTPEDFYERRTGRLYFNIESVTKYLDDVIADFAEYFDWDEEKTAQEKEKILERVKEVSHFEPSTVKN
ncbi:MAG: glycerol-3-phosphate dehydrogenase [Flammeovirgaceae bacterium]